MTLQADSIEDIRRALTEAAAARSTVGAIRLTGLRRVLAHVPEDMTVSSEAGLTLGALQLQLAERGQWVPVDPPNADQLSIGDLLATNASGPRRYGLGTVRDWLIGIAVVLADGRVVRSGGKVVKNVAGFDLLKLFVGSHGSLGVIVEATFKLLPLPEAEQFVQCRCESLEQADDALAAIQDSSLSPMALELHRNVKPGSPDDGLYLTAGFAGAREDVEWQVTGSKRLGFTEAGSLEHERQFWSNADDPPKRIVVLPSRLVGALREIGNAPFVARAGNGIIYHRGESAPSRPSPAPPVAELSRRLKAAFDPNRLLPELPA